MHGRVVASGLRGRIPDEVPARTSVRAIAPDVLGVPVVVPEPGEYVALGAARQASSAITG